MRLFLRNTFIALIGIAGLTLFFWCFHHAFDWVVFHVFHLPEKGRPVFMRELESWCEIGLGGLIASVVLKWKPKLSSVLDIETPEHYSVVEPLAFGLVLFAMIAIGAVAITRFH